MTIDQIILQKKSEALNKVRKIYHPLTKNPYSNYLSSDGTYTEQRDEWVRDIMYNLEKDIKKLKQDKKNANGNNK